jgi:hypothetical protein
MITLDVISEDQAAMMELTNHALSKRGLMCGSFSRTEAKKVMGVTQKQTDQLLSYMQAEQIITKHGHLYWINQGS